MAIKWRLKNTINMIVITRKDRDLYLQAITPGGLIWTNKVLLAASFPAEQADTYVKTLNKKEIKCVAIQL